MKTLLDRYAIAQATHDRFVGRTFDWKDADCIRLFKWHVMRAGHPNPLKGLREWSGETGAVLALRSAAKSAKLAKTATLADLIDVRGYQRIDAAQALVGDIIGLQGADPWGVAVGICMGNGKALAFAPDPESGNEVCMVGEALLNVNGVVPAMTAWSLY